MNALQLIQEARQDGLAIRVENGQVKLRGPAQAIEKWKPALVEQKREIIEALSTQPTATGIDPEAERLARQNAAAWGWDDEDLNLLFDVLRRQPPEIQIQNVHAITEPFKDIALTDFDHRPAANDFGE